MFGILREYPWGRVMTVGLMLIGTAILLFFPLSSVFADIAPPQMPPGANPLPGEEITQVRMVSEQVLIEVLREVPQGSLGQARVTAEFKMRNLGNATETLLVRFPLMFNDSAYHYPEITDFRVWKDGAELESHSYTLTEEHENPYQAVKWVNFQVAFPPEQDVWLKVMYTLDGTGEYPYVSYRYVLETGAGWKDTIGTADITVRLPYQANAYNVLLDASPGWDGTSAGGVLAGNEIRWHYENLEPQREDNFAVVIVVPEAWERVLIERDNVQKNPNDGEAWGRLGKAYKEICALRRGIRYDAAGEELFRLGMEAYQRALELLPNDALWHAGYGDLLFQKYVYDNQSDPVVREWLTKAVKEFHTAYMLDPDNPKLHEMLDSWWGKWWKKEGDEYIFVWLTATPTLFQTKTETPAPPLVASPTPKSEGAQPSLPTEAPSPTFFPSPLPATATEMLVTPLSTANDTPAEASPSLPFCQGEIFLPLAGAIGYLAVRRKHRRLLG